LNLDVLDRSAEQAYQRWELGDQMVAGGHGVKVSRPVPRNHGSMFLPTHAASGAETVGCENTGGFPIPMPSADAPFNWSLDA